MWDAAINIIDRFGLSISRRSLVRKILSYFNIPPKGTVIVFEKDDYQDYINHAWRRVACHLNIKDGGTEEMSPEHLLRLMESKEYAHLIWLSKQACEEKEMRFTWILAHELRHLEQDLLSPTLSKAGHFLRIALGGIEIEEPKVVNLIPTELDADMKARQIIQKLFGVEASDEYMKKESIDGNHKESFQIVISQNPDKSYDVFGKTILLLRKYQHEFEELQKQRVNTHIAGFDINAICFELERIRNRIQKVNGLAYRDLGATDGYEEGKLNQV